MHKLQACQPRQLFQSTNASKVAGANGKLLQAGSEIRNYFKRMTGRLLVLNVIGDNTNAWMLLLEMENICMNDIGSA